MKKETRERRLNRMIPGLSISYLSSGCCRWLLSVVGLVLVLILVLEFSILFFGKVFFSFVFVQLTGERIVLLLIFLFLLSIDRSFFYLVYIERGRELIVSMGIRNRFRMTWRPNFHLCLRLVSCFEFE